MIELDEFKKDYDWIEVLRFGGIPGEDCYTSAAEACPPGASPVTDAAMDCTRFCMDDVVEVIAAADGENDGEDWRCTVRLNDGRFAYIEAGCDYTGWG